MQKCGQILLILLSKTKKGNIVSEIVNVNGDNYSEKIRWIKLLWSRVIDWRMVRSRKNHYLDNKRYNTLHQLLKLVENGEISGLHPGLKIDDIFEAMKVYYASQARTELEDMLSYPISIILDGNYPIELKQEIIEFIDDVRDDVHFMLSRAEYSTKNYRQCYWWLTQI